MQRICSGMASCQELKNAPKGGMLQQLAFLTCWTGHQGGPDDGLLISTNVYSSCVALRNALAFLIT